MHVQNSARCTAALHLGTRLRGLRGPDSRVPPHPRLTSCMQSAAARQEGTQRCGSRHHESQPVSKGTPGRSEGWSGRAGCGAKGRRSPRSGSCRRRPCRWRRSPAMDTCGGMGVGDRGGGDTSSSPRSGATTRAARKSCVRRAHRSSEEQGPCFNVQTKILG